MIDFLKVQPWPLDKPIPDGLSLSPKMDGWRIRVHIEKFGFKVYTRRDEISRYLKTRSDTLVPQSTANMMYEAEMYVPGANASEVVTAYKTAPHRLRFFLIAVLKFDGMEMKNDPPENLWTFKEVFPLMEMDQIRTKNDTVDELLQSAKKDKIEGWILKERMYWNWWKLKVANTADVVVTGFKDGKGKYDGHTGALLCSVYKDGKLTEIASVSGMSDKERFAIDEEADMGRVCEIEFDRVDKNRLRHPRFLRWREDKKRKQCTWEQFCV